MLNYYRDFEVGDMVVVTRPGIGVPYTKGDLGFVAFLDNKNGVAWVFFDITQREDEKPIPYEEIEKFNPNKAYK